MAASRSMSRRDVIKGASILAGGAAVAPALARDVGPEARRIVKNGRINQSASRWCYGKLPLEKLCQAGAEMGLKGIDLLGPKDFPTLKQAIEICDV